MAWVTPRLIKELTHSTDSGQLALQTQWHQSTVLWVSGDSKRLGSSLSPHCPLEKSQQLPCWTQAIANSAPALACHRRAHRSEEPDITEHACHSCRAGTSSSLGDRLKTCSSGSRRTTPSLPRARVPRAHQSQDRHKLAEPLFLRKCSNAAPPHLSSMQPGGLPGEGGEAGRAFSCLQDLGLGRAGPFPCALLALSSGGTERNIDFPQRSRRAASHSKSALTLNRSFVPPTKGV